MKFNQNFIGYAFPPGERKFSGGDSEDLFKYNLKHQPLNWYYRFNEITYEYNSLGHRSKNIEDTNLDNYILFTGCSHTEGIGLELEKTFPYLTAKELGTDYYNLALGGSGIDSMTYNLMVWIHTVKKLPKALVIMWPQTSRFLLSEKGTEFFSFEVPSCATSSDNEKFMVMGDKINFFETVKQISKKAIDVAYPCKIIHLIPEMLGGMDKARDLAHAGILSNQRVADQIVQQLSA